MSGTPVQQVTFPDYVANVQAGFTAARAALARTDARLREQLGGPDPDLTDSNAAVMGFLADMAAVHPADVAPGEPVTPDPLPTPPAEPGVPDADQPIQ